MIKKDQELLKILWNQLLNELFKSNTSMVVYGDDQGEPYLLVKNRKVNQCMNHIDIHQHFCVTYRGRRRWLDSLCKVRRTWQMLLQRAYQRSYLHDTWKHSRVKCVRGRMLD